MSLSFAGLSRLAGFEIPLAQAAEKLTAIGIASVPEGQGNDRSTATIPSLLYISIEEDLVEQVMRLVGYDRAPARLPRSSRGARPSPARRRTRTAPAIRSPRSVSPRFW